MFTCLCLACVTSYTKNKTAPRPTCRGNALDPSSLLKNLENDSCAVLC